MKRIPKPASIFAAPSWELHSSRVSLAVTREGGHLGPVEFDLGTGEPLRPFHIAPWAGEKLSRELPPILRVLRGDFFCMPFGGNATPWRGEKHPVHGESANATWTLETLTQSATWSVLEAGLETRIRKFRVTKRIALRTGHAAVYSRHTITGGSGLMSFGHHAMLNFSKGGGLVSVSPFVRGQVFPGEFENPAAGGYSCLKPGAMFRSLDRVPMRDGQSADLSHYPAREGFEDLVMVSSKPGTTLGWSAVVFPGNRTVWFSLRDPRVLASTILWHSHGGRHYAPWNGRHRSVLGLEDVTSYFHTGLAESAAPNPVSKSGIPTCLPLETRKPLVVNTIFAMTTLPRGFDHVREIHTDADGVTLTSRSGKSAFAALDAGFLYGDEATG